MLFTVLATGSTVISSVQTSKAQRFEENGRQATATVEERSIIEWTNNDGETKENHYLTVTFRTRDSQEITVKEDVDRGRYHSVREGGTLPLIYLQDAPENILFSIDDTRWIATTAQKVALGLGVLALGWLWCAGSRAVAAVRARRYGKRETATVTGIKKGITWQ